MLVQAYDRQREKWMNAGLTGEMNGEGEVRMRRYWMDGWMDGWMDTVMTGLCNLEAGMEGTDGCRG